MYIYLSVQRENGLCHPNNMNMVDNIFAIQYEYSCAYTYEYVFALQHIFGPALFLYTLLAR